MWFTSTIVEHITVEHRAGCGKCESTARFNADRIRIASIGRLIRLGIELFPTSSSQWLANGDLTRLLSVKFLYKIIRCTPRARHSPFFGWKYFFKVSFFQ